MATNGNNPSPLQSHQMPTPTAGAPYRGQKVVEQDAFRAAAPATVDPAAAADDITSQIADTARMIRDIGRYAKEHGDYLQKLSDSFADRLQESAQNYALDLLNSERRKLAELEKIMGRGTKHGDGA